MLQGKFSEMHEYYMSILKIRLGEGIYEAVYKKVYTSDYYTQVAAKYSILTKFPDYLQMLLISNADLKQPHYLLNTFELYNILDQTLDQLFSFLEINIDTTRRMHWQEVYSKWKKLHTKRLKFVWYFDTIVDYIVNGYDLGLLNFDLDLLQEATIQHELIYKHNLNLKTFQLEKFTNTKQLHNLLEPNIHPLGNY